MIIKRITVVAFGSVEFFSESFNPELNVIETPFPSQLSAAIEILLCNRPAPNLCSFNINNKTRIFAEVLLENEPFFVNASPLAENFNTLSLSACDKNGNDATDFYLYSLLHCAEQDFCESFNGRDDLLPHRLCLYRDGNKSLLDRTNYIIRTASFRAHLAQYIRNFKPQPINCKKNYLLTINKEGNFEVTDPNGTVLPHLSETEHRLFSYICFLNVAEFWDEIEKKRNMHRKRKPLLIKNLLEFLDPCAEIDGLVKRTLQLNRQALLLTLPSHPTCPHAKK